MIIIHPWARRLRNGKINPKNYPHWRELISRIDEPIIQIGVEGEEQLVEDFRKNQPLKELSQLVNECKTWIAIDSFFQHFCWDLEKSGIVLWGQSDPWIFGHRENINLLKDRKYLREKQFWWWEQTEYNVECFVKPDVILDALKTFNIKLK